MRVTLILITTMILTMILTMVILIIIMEAGDPNHDHQIDPNHGDPNQNHGYG